METKVRKFISQFHMLEPHEHIIVGVSGGADSVCLLFLLYRFMEELSLSISVVHVNHRIRQSAERDELFVKELCERLKLPFYAVGVDVRELAGREGLTVEEAGRLARFRVFSDKKRELLADKIALAHHMTDQAETVLFHMSRGCGLDGLVGIRPVRDDVIHPLLCADRAEIEAYLQEKGIRYMTDETNSELVYRRNILRHKVLPVLEEEICHGAVEHIAAAAGICLEAADFLKGETVKCCEENLRYQNRENGDILILDRILTLHPYLQRTVVLDAIEKAAGRRKDIGTVHVDGVLTLLAKQPGRRMNLPYSLVAERTYDGVRLARQGLLTRQGLGEQKELTALQELWEQSLVPDDIGRKSQEIPLGNDKILSLRVFPYEKSFVIEQKTYTKWFDYDKINGHLTVRTRRSGDYLYLDGQKRQTVKAYMINNKIPRYERDAIWLVTQKDHVLWMIGYRISSYYKVSENTKNILEITVSGGRTDGGEN